MQTPRVSHLLLKSKLIQNLWNSLEINKIWMEHSVELMLFPRSWWLRMWNYGRQHHLKLKLLLVLEQSLNWGSVDQELHQCLPPCRYLVHIILLIPYVLMKSWLIPKVLEDGAYSFFIPRSWAVVGLNNLHRNVPCYLFRFPAHIFIRIFFKRGSGFPMVLSSRSKCMILTYGQDIWPCSSYL